MSIIKLSLLATALFIVGCNPPENRNENKNPSPTATATPAATDSPKKETPCKPLQQPCDGKLLVRHAYSQCCNKVWHVVEDDYYNCATDPFRVWDKETEQTCDGKAVPPGLGSPYGEIRDLCPNPMPTDEKIWITECFHDHWRTALYTVYKCPDGNAKGIHKAITDKTIEHQVACTDPMPPFKPPTP